jgi:hypothetical protein
VAEHSAGRHRPRGAQRAGGGVVGRVAFAGLRQAEAAERQLDFGDARRLARIDREFDAPRPAAGRRLRRFRVPARGGTRRGAIAGL